MMLAFILAAFVGAPDEAALRESFSKDVQSTEASQRVQAVKKLSGAREEKTLELLAKSLSDPALEVRKAAAETIEGSTDGGGVAIAPLGDILVDKKADLDLRLACAKALAKARYKSLSFPYFHKTISSIEPEERQFYRFGADVTTLLDKYVGRSFGADKTTAENWGVWWMDNHEALEKADQKLREEWKKEQGR